MNIKFSENFVVYRPAMNTLENLLQEYESLQLQLGQSNNSDSNLAAQQKIAEIKLHYGKANSLYYQQKYQEALSEYKTTHALIYQLMNPSFNIGVAQYPGFDFPVTVQTFDPILKGCLEIVEVIKPPIPDPLFGIDVKDIPGSVIDPIGPYAQLGVQIMSSLPPEVEKNAELGLDYANRKQWDKAETLFRSALKGVENAKTQEELSAKASLELNLSSVLIQKGNIDEAKTLINNATKDFKSVGDEVGMSQAKVNLASAKLKEGSTYSAKQTLRSAGKDLASAEGGAAINNVITSIKTYVPGLLTRNVTSEEPVRQIQTKISATKTTTDPKAINTLAKNKEFAVVYRKLAGEAGWALQDIETKIENTAKSYNKQVNYLVGDTVVSLQWQKGKSIDSNQLKSQIYAKRVTENDFMRIRPNFELYTDVALNLPHLYSFTLPVCIGDCYHHLGEFQKAFYQYKKASTYPYINQTYEIPSLWIKIARNYLEWGNYFYKDYNPDDAVVQYTQVITLDDKAPQNSFLYTGVMDSYGNKVEDLIKNIQNAENSALNPNVITIVLDIRTQLIKIAAGLDFTGFPVNYFPIFKYGYLQSVARYFAKQAIQAEREYISFYSKGENETLTKLQLQQSLEVSSAEVELSQKQLEYAQAELTVTQKNIDLVNERIQNAETAKTKYASIAYEQALLSAANAFASGPEGYEVSYTYYSPSEGKTITLSGSDAYKVMEDIAYRKGMLSRDMELFNMQNNIDEMKKAKNVAVAQKASAQARVNIAEQQKIIAQMRKKHARELLNAFDNQVFTPEVWFDLGNHLYYISKTYLYYAIDIAKKMEAAYELENGIKVTIIKNEYNTNILSGLLSADYLLQDIDYFDVHYISMVKSMDIPAKKTYSLSELNPVAFGTTFKETGRIDFNTSLEFFDRAYPGSYLRKIKRVEVAVVGMLPAGGITATLKNSGIAVDRKQNGDTYYRIQPYETLLVSEYNIKQDAFIFQGSQKVLDVFENTGVSTNWTFELSPDANDVNFDLISDVQITIYYSARYDALLQNSIKAALPATGEKSMAIPFQSLFPDEYYTFLDTAELSFELTSADFAYNETDLKIKNIAVQVVTKAGVSSKNIAVTLENVDLNSKVEVLTNDNGIIRSDNTDAANALNVFIDKALCGNWKITVKETDTFKAKSVNKLFLFTEYGFKYRGV